MSLYGRDIMLMDKRIVLCLSINIPSLWVYWVGRERIQRAIIHDHG